MKDIAQQKALDDLRRPHGLEINLKAWLALNYEVLTIDVVVMLMRQAHQVGMTNAREALLEEITDILK